MISTNGRGSFAVPRRRQRGFSFIGRTAKRCLLTATIVVVASRVSKIILFAIKETGPSKKQRAANCFELLDEYPMSMGCHKSVYRVKPCNAKLEDGPVYILSTANDTSAPTSVEAEVLARASASAPGTVPTVIATCSDDNDDNGRFFLVQELLLHGTAYADTIDKDDGMETYSPVARLRIAASGFAALRLFDNFPLTLNVAGREKNLQFASGASSKSGWFPTRLDGENPSKTEWRHEKVFFRDFGMSQVGIDLAGRKMKVIDLLSPYYLLYEGIDGGNGKKGRGVLSEMQCQTDQECFEGYKARYVKAAHVRFAKTVPPHQRINITDHVNDISCDINRGKCMGLDERTLTYWIWGYFRHTLQPLQSREDIELIRPQLNELIGKISHEDKNQRPLPQTVATELYRLSNELENAGHLDKINFGAIEATSKKEYVTEPWSKVCKNKIGVRNGERAVEDDVTFVGNCKLRRRGY